MGTRGAIASSLCFAGLSFLSGRSCLWTFPVAALARFSHASFCAVPDFPAPQYFPGRSHELDAPHRDSTLRVWTHRVFLESNFLVALASLLAQSSTCHAR